MTVADKEGRTGASGSAALIFQATQNPPKCVRGRRRVSNGEESLELRVLKGAWKQGVKTEGAKD